MDDGPRGRPLDFSRTTADAGIAVIEGVMGLFDGVEPTSDTGSTAEIA
jgi:cobyrinic acid a,c-diamide synthase